MQPMAQTTAGGTYACRVTKANDETDTPTPRMGGRGLDGEVLHHGQTMPCRTRLQGGVGLPRKQGMRGTTGATGKGMGETEGGAAMSKCRYCGSSAYGSCPKSPCRVHEHIDDDRHCEFCGSTAYGSCPKSPFKRHRHGHGNDKCVWCGSRATGSCPKSPSGRHER